AGVLSLILGLVTISGAVTLWFVIIIALFLGVLTAIDNPTRQTFTMEMVGRERLTNAVSLNTATFTIARVLGPGVAGFMIAAVGIGECFIINAASCVPVTIALFVMRKHELRPADRVERRRGQVREGIRYVASVPVLKALLIMMAVIGTLEYNFIVILPVLAKVTFGGNASTLGLLGSVLGMGMLVGSITNAAFGRPSRRVLVGAAVALGVSTLLLAASPSVWLACVLMVPLGAASMAYLATMNSTLQLNSSDAMRGRVMALYFVLFLGSTPIGAPIIGWVAETFTARAALGLGGIATLLACVYAYLRLPPLTSGARGHEDVEEIPAAVREPV
ncbi:MAG: MFS transporter, partial [Actinomycetota bacterium]